MTYKISLRKSECNAKNTKLNFATGQNNSSASIGIIVVKM